MKASEIMLDETLPHGTREGFAAGCRGSHCPGIDRTGMSCKQASIRYAADYSYKRRIDNGLSPEAVWAEDQLEQVDVPKRVDNDTRFTPVKPEPTVTIADSETPVTFAAVEPPAPRKWAVRRLWVAVSPKGSMHGPFGDHVEGMRFVGEQLSKAAAAPRRGYRRFTLEEISELTRMNGEGLGDGAIAKVLGREQSSVKKRREAMGLPSNTARVGSVR